MTTGVALITALALAACGGSHSSSGHDSSMPGMHSTASAPAGDAFNDADVMFAQMMIPHHRQAVEMATLAETRAADAQVKRLAGQIKAAQDPEIATMTGWLTGWGRPTTAPGGMNHGNMSNPGTGSMPGMMSDADLATLKAASGKDFDRQFCALMIAHHQGAIEMAKQERSDGANADAKALAGRIVTGQQGEIDTMNTIIGKR